MSLDMDRIAVLGLEADTYKEVELSTGDKVRFKTFLPINEKRAIARVIVSSSLRVREGEEIFRVDPSLAEVAECYSFIRHLTDIEVVGVNLDELVDNLEKSGLKEEIYNNLDKKIVKEIRSMVKFYTEEEIKIREITSSLEYKIGKIIEQSSDDSTELIEALKGLNENQGLVEQIKTMERLNARQVDKEE